MRVERFNGSDEANAFSTDYNMIFTSVHLNKVQEESTIQGQPSGMTKKSSFSKHLEQVPVLITV